MSIKWKLPNSFSIPKKKYKVGELFGKSIVAGDLNLTNNDEFYLKTNSNNEVERLLDNKGNIIIGGGDSDETTLSVIYSNLDWMGLPIILEGEEGFHKVFDQVVEQVLKTDGLFSVVDLNTDKYALWDNEKSEFEDLEGLIPDFTTLHVYEIYVTDPVLVTVSGKQRDPESTLFSLKENSTTYIPYLFTVDKDIVLYGDLSFITEPTNEDEIETNQLGINSYAMYDTLRLSWGDHLVILTGHGISYFNNSNSLKPFTWKDIFKQE